MAVFLLCLHDIGKFAKKFQAKVPDLYPVCFDDDLARLSVFYDHGAGGLRLFDAEDGFFELPNGTRHRAWRPLVSAVTGHHGAPPDTCGRDSIATLKSDFGAAGIEAARRFVRKTHDLFDIPQDMPPLRRKQVRPASFALAGLAVLADWISAPTRSGFPIVSRKISRTSGVTGTMRGNERAAPSKKRACFRPTHAIEWTTTL